MTPLEKYVEEYNRRETLWSSRPRLVTFPLSTAHRRVIRQRVEGELSPENLWRDGEASPEEAREKRDRLRAVLNSL